MELQTTLDPTPSGSERNQPTSQPSTNARPLALTRLDAFKIMIRLAKKLMFLRLLDIPIRTRVKLVEKLLGFQMSAQSLVTQKKIITSISRFICKYETMYKNCKYNVNNMEEKYKSLVSKEFRIVHPSNLVFHTTPYSKIYDEDAAIQLIQEILVSVHSDPSKTSTIWSGQNQFTSEHSSEGRSSAVTRLEAFKIMLRVAKKLKLSRPRYLPSQTKVKLVEKLLGFEMSAQALDTQKNTIKSIVNFIYKHENMYENCKWSINVMERKHKSLVSKEFRLVNPSNLVFHTTPYSKINDEDATLQLIEEILVSSHSDPSLTCQSWSGQNEPSFEARPSALTRLEAFKIMLRVAKKLKLSRPRYLPSQTKVKLFEKLLGFEMSAQALDTQKNTIKSIVNFIYKHENMYENCKWSINVMERKHKSLVSKEFRLVNPSNLVFHTTPYSKINDEDATLQLIEEILVSVHSDPSKTSTIWSGQNQFTSEHSSEGRSSAVTRLEAFKIMLRVAKKLKLSRPRYLPSQTKVKLVEKLLGFEMSAQALDTQKNTIKSIVNFIYKHENMYENCKWSINVMERKHKSLVSKEFRLVNPSNLVFHTTPYSKINDEDATLQLIEEILVSSHSDPSLTCQSWSGQNEPSFEARPSALTRLEAFKIMLRVAKKLKLSRPRYLPSQTKVKLFEKLLGFEMSAQALDTQKNTIKSIVNFIYKHENMYENCKWSINVMERKHKSLVSKEFRLVNPSNLVFHTTPYSKINDEDATLQLIEEILVSSHSDPSLTCQSWSGQNEPSFEARPSALTRLEAFKIMLRVAKKLKLSRPRYLPSQTKVKLFEKLLGFEMSAQALDTQKNTIKSIVNFIYKHENMYENCKWSINAMERKYKSLVSKEFRLVNPSNLVFHTTPYSKINDEDATLQLIEEILVSSHSDPSLTCQSWSGQNEPSFEARPSALTRLEAFKIMLRVAKKLKHSQPRELLNQTKVKLVEKLLGFEMSAQALDTQKKTVKSIINFIYRYEAMYKNCQCNVNIMEKKYKSLMFKEFRLALPSNLVFHTTSCSKIDEASLEQFIKESLLPEENDNNLLLIEDTTTVDHRQKLWSRKSIKVLNNEYNDTETESGPPPKIVKTFTETVITDLGTLNSPNQKTNQDNTNYFKICSFCKMVRENFTEITNTRSYVTSNRTKIALNEMSIEIRFDEDTTPKYICWDCDRKLVDMLEFIETVSKAQDRLNHTSIVVDLDDGFGKQKDDELSMYCNSDDLDYDNKYNQTYIEDEESGSFKETDIKHMREAAEEENRLINNKCWNNDCDPLSLNNDLDNNETDHNYDESDDKEYVKKVIVDDTITNDKIDGKEYIKEVVVGDTITSDELDDNEYDEEVIVADTIINDLNEDSDINVKVEITETMIGKEFLSDPNVRNEPGTDKDDLIVNIKEESVKDHEKNHQHDIELDGEPSELHQDMNHLRSDIRSDRLVNARKTVTSDLVNGSSREIVGVLPKIELSLLKKTIMRKMMKK